MINSLVDIIKSGDRDALNAYLSQQSIGGDSGGISINGQQNNALSALMRPQQAQQTQQPNQQPIVRRNLGFAGPAGDLLNENADQNWKPQSTPITNDSIAALPEVQQYRQQQQALREYQARQAAAEKVSNPYGFQPPRNEAERQQQIDMTMKRQLLQSQINAGNMKEAPKYEASNNSFIIPPDAQHPQGQVIPAGGQGGAASQQNTLTGNDLLQTLAKPQADQVKALAEGRMAFPAGFALKSPYWQDMISKVSQYDPNFDAVNYNARSQTRSDFTKGASANNVTALNTAIQHLGKLSDAYGQLDNGSMPMVNTVTNALGNAFGNDNIQKNYAAVSVDSTAVAHELAKVFRQSGMSEGEIKDWESKISTSASPTQSKQVIQSAMDLMQGRLESLGARYNQGMGTTKQPYELLTPEAKQTWNRLNPGQSNQPAQSGNSVTAPDGSVHSFPNAAAADGFRKAIGLR